MSSRENLAVAEAPQRHVQQSSEVKSVGRSKSFQKKAHVLDFPPTRRLAPPPVVNCGVPYNIIRVGGGRAGVVITAKGDKVNDFSMWFTHIDEKKAGRMINLEYSPAHGNWYCGTTGPCEGCGLACTNPAHGPLFRLERRKVRHAVEDRIIATAHTAVNVVRAVRSGISEIRAFLGKPKKPAKR